jgi:hypothetical protein
MREEALKRDKEETLRLIAMKQEEEAERRPKEESAVPSKAQLPGASVAVAVAATQSAGSKRRNRWD